MTPEEVLQAAVEKKTPAERVAYLEAACRQDSALRAQVEGLLKAHEEAGSFLEQSLFEPAAATTAEPPRERPGVVIGPYKLIEVIGEGGMGTVWMAQQTEPVKRLVALKLIKAGMDSKQVIARFEVERQALALMDHANIARVLDSGATSAGRPYFVMDLVKGIPITKYCDEHRLTPRQRLELFIPVCQAIQHAHQKSIIHRDLKPSNVLVAPYDGRPVPKVIDFGVAKAAGQTLTEKTLVTGFGAMVGTLEYMSPEQAEINQLDVDTRSDIYSLGVLLYELLAGSPPFSSKDMEKAGMFEMLRVIREQEPSKPSTKLSTAEGLPTLAANRGTEPAKLAKVVRGELDWIVMKALEKDRNRRYETATGFARDIQRYLADEPVQACPPSVAYRLRKFVRRNRAAFVTVSVVMLAVLFVVGSVGWVVRDRTAREQEIARDRSARQALVRERVTMALEEARKRHQEGRGREALDAAKRAEALAATGEIEDETHKRVREVLGDMQMLANLEDVRALSTANESGFDLKEEDSGNARAFREYGIDIDALDRDEAARLIKSRKIHHDLTVFLDSWSHVRRRLGAAQGGKDWKELLEVARLADPDPWRDRFRQAVLSGDRKALVELAASVPISSLTVETVDRLGDALLGDETLTEAVAFLRKGQRLYPQDYWINVNLANGLLRMGPQHLEEALQYYMAAVALRPEAALSHFNLGNALAGEGKLDEAVACFRKAIELSPKRSSLHEHLAKVLQNQARPEEAAAAYREAARLRSEEAVEAARTTVRLRPDDPMTHFNLGAILSKQGKVNEAIASYQEALRRKPEQSGLPILNSLVGDFLLCSDPKSVDAKRMGELVEQVLAQTPAVAENPEFLASSAPLLLLAGRGDAYRQHGARLAEKFGNTTNARTAFLVARNCALAPDAVYDPARVVQIAERAVRAQPSPHYLHALGLAHYRAGQFDRAIDYLQQSNQGTWRAQAANWLVLAMVQQRLGHADEARRWFDKASQWMDGNSEGSRDSRKALQSIHPHDALACMVLRREAEALLSRRAWPSWPSFIFFPGFTL